MSLHWWGVVCIHAFILMHSICQKVCFFYKLPWCFVFKMCLSPVSQKYNLSQQERESSVKLHLNVSDSYSSLLCEAWILPCSSVITLSSVVFSPLECRSISQPLTRCISRPGPVWFVAISFLFCHLSLLFFFFTPALILHTFYLLNTHCRNSSHESLTFPYFFSSLERAADTGGSMSSFQPRGVHRCGQASEQRPHGTAAEGGETARGLQLYRERPAASGCNGGGGQVRTLMNKLE